MRTLSEVFLLAVAYRRNCTSARRLMDQHVRKFSYAAVNQPLRIAERGFFAYLRQPSVHTR
jgi:hypothetical protein